MPAAAYIIKWFTSRRKYRHVPEIIDMDGLFNKKRKIWNDMETYAGLISLAHQVVNNRFLFWTDCGVDLIYMHLFGQLHGVADIAQNRIVGKLGNFITVLTETEDFCIQAFPFQISCQFF
jgi:hypothetical protein